ncbi:MAG TPA: NADH-quinone oxidoreductase subunit J [Candidatus Baltobacteraceae bacterium]|jgi:NADH-quinone oxidoreductase subunit J|nr:NADH-quinone oxidoreductase subunit J [Candidatus Baltobacteraceae bacterium]
MNQLFFYVFAVLTLLCGALVIANPISRSPVTSAMFLVLTIVSMAGLFVLLHAFFLAAVQVLVYAGAVMVLFLFVIMLLDLKEEEQRRIKASAAALGVLAVGLIAVVMILTVHRSRLGLSLENSLVEGSTIALGRDLFTRFALPFEIISLVLLVAMIGTVLLSRKDLR